MDKNNFPIASAEHPTVLQDGIQAKRRSLWKGSTTRQKLLLLYIVCGEFTVYLCASSPYPFMRRVVLERGGTSSEASILLQVPLLSMAISSILFGKFQAYVNSKTLFLVGLIGFGTCNASFGLLGFVESTKAFVYGGIGIRAIQGVAQGAYAVSSLTIICSEFTDHIAKVFGVAQSMISVGFICGPMLGSLLYSVSENTLVPFVASSGFVLPLIPIACCCLRSSKIDKREHKISLVEIIQQPVAVFMIMTVMMTSGAFGLSNVLSPHYFASAGFTMLEIGSAMLTQAAAVAITAFGTGFVLSFGYTIQRVIFAVGLIGLVSCQLLLSPTQTVTGIYIAVALQGLSCAFLLLSAFNKFMDEAAKIKSENTSDLAFHGAVSGVWNLASNMGLFVSPLLGSQFYAFMSYRFVKLTCLAIGIVLAALASLLAWGMHGGDAEKRKK